MLSRIVPGAEAVILTWNDAVELDLKPNRLTFDLKVDAGRRLVNATKIVLPSLRVGGIEFTNLDAFIARDYEIETTVLGAAFLKRLKVAHATDDDIFMLAKN